MDSSKKQGIMSPLKIPRLNGYWTKQKSGTSYFSDLDYSIRAQEEPEMLVAVSESMNREPMELVQQHELSDAKMVLFEEHVVDRRTRRMRQSVKCIR